MSTLPDDPNAYCFIDTETRAFDGTDAHDGDVSQCGAYRYRNNAHIIVITYAVGDAPVRCVALDHGFDQPLYWKDLPLDLREFFNKAQVGKGWFVAWNAAFDRLMIGSQFERAGAPDEWLDAMAQAVASNLPPDLAGASRVAGLKGKMSEGKELIPLFCSADGATPQSEPEKWEQFKQYAIRDTEELRAIWQACRKLPLEEWQVYWANEEINDRGMLVDTTFARAAAKVAHEDRARTNAQLAQLTGGLVPAVTQLPALVDWVFNVCPHPQVREIMVTSWQDADEASEREPEQMGLARERIEAILAFYAALEEKQDGLDEIDICIADALELRLWGGSASPGKFAKALGMIDDDNRLKGQYVFNGAQQTMRFSSRGVQVHNLTRSTLGEKEAAAIELISSLED